MIAFLIHFAKGDAKIDTKGQTYTQSLRSKFSHLVVGRRSRWEWAGSDLALDMALRPQGQFLGPWIDPFREKHAALLAHWVP
jgi:hypothetical protein